MQKEQRPKEDRDKSESRKDTVSLGKIFRDVFKERWESDKGESGE